MTNQEFRKEISLKSFTLARNIIKLVDSFPKKQSSRVITDQLLRSSTSIGANIIEAQGASSRKDFINFLHHALKSAHETRYWLLLSKDLDQSLIVKIEKELVATED